MSPKVTCTTRLAGMLSKIKVVAIELHRRRWAQKSLPDLDPNDATKEIEYIDRVCAPYLVSGIWTSSPGDDGVRALLLVLDGRL